MIVVYTRLRRSPNPLVTTPFTRRAFLAGAAGAGARRADRQLARASVRARPRSPAAASLPRASPPASPSPDGITLWTKLSQLERPGGRSSTRSRATPTSAGAGRPAAAWPRPPSATSRSPPAWVVSARRAVLLPLPDLRQELARRALPHPPSRRLQRADPHRLLLLPGMERRLLHRACGARRGAGPRCRRLPRDYVYERNYYESAPAPTPPGRTRTATSSRCRSTATSTGSTTPIRTSCGARDALAVRDLGRPRGRGQLRRRPAGRRTPVHRVPFLQRRANGYQAFFEHMPLVRDAAAPDRVYGTVELGRHAELFVLDQRRYRSDQPCGGPVAQPCPEADSPAARCSARRRRGSRRARGLAARPGSSSATR